MNPEATSSTPPEFPAENPVVGYCRACGKALDAASVHTAHGTIYCLDHLPSGPPPAGFSDPADASPYTSKTPPPVPHSDVSPGVGAVYNGQYAKGLVHVVIFGSIISILSSGAARGFEPLFGLMIPTFVFYMCFEAYHTAKLRRLGQPVDEFSSLVPGHGGSRFPAAPILLIALGVVFLLNNLELVELRRLLRYWPVMLIVLGVYMLYLRMTGSASEVDRER